LQSETTNDGLGYMFDDSGVHEVFKQTASRYDDGKPCYLLVSADDEEIVPTNALNFCEKIIVVTSPDLEKKKRLKRWKKSRHGKDFIDLPPKCHEVVYLLYVKLFR